jgi:ubiquinol-cytochrome c reductase subunit 9
MIKALHNTVLRRTSTFTLAICVGAFFFERAFDLASDNLFKSINKGVSSNTKIT